MDEALRVQDSVSDIVFTQYCSSCISKDFLKCRGTKPGIGLMALIHGWDPESCQKTFGLCACLFPALLFPSGAGVVAWYGCCHTHLDVTLVLTAQQLQWFCEYIWKWPLVSSSAYLHCKCCRAEFGFAQVTEPSCRKHYLSTFKHLAIMISLRLCSKSVVEQQIELKSLGYYVPSLPIPSISVSFLWRGSLKPISIESHELQEVMLVIPQKPLVHRQQ